MTAQEAPTGAGVKTADVKLPTTRLLDMMAGWSHYAQSDGFPDAEGVVEEICDLYQQAGEVAFNDTRSRVQTEAALRAFLVDRVLPALVR